MPVASVAASELGPISGGTWLGLAVVPGPGYVGRRSAGLPFQET